MNRDRLEHKVDHWNDGAWVRDAARAHAAKRRARTEVA
jgi:ring-1,2-phenylacetyl-CoA epoxidase subunit PaaA